MQRFSRFAAHSALAAALALSLFTTAAVAQDTSQDTSLSSSADVAGQVYVNNNSPDQNTISGFDRHADGSLTPIGNDGVFATGGAGTGMPIATQGAIQFSADHRFVLAVDPGSNEISVLRIKHDGTLDQRNAVSSGGNAPGSLAVAAFRSHGNSNSSLNANAAHGSLVYVVNTGAGGANYTGFTLNPGGKLNPIADSTFALPDNAFPGQILFSSDGVNAAGTRTGGTPTEPTLGPSQIDSFTINAQGLLEPAPGSPFDSQRIGPIGAEYGITDPSVLFVTNAHDGPGLGSVSAYKVADDSSLSPLDGSPFANQQTATCWAEISADGQYMFVVNTATPSISSYQIADDGTLTLLGNTLFNNATAPFDARLDPSGDYLYVVDNGAPLIHAFSVDGGTLTELEGSPFANPGQGAPFGIIVD
jgi:6-phosphogluconolactonase (cycloisomerase 2 family)